MRPVMQRLCGFLVYASILLLCVLMLLTIPRFLHLQAGIIEIVSIPRYWLSLPLAASLLLIAADAFVQVISLATGKTQFVAFGEIKVV